MTQFYAYIYRDPSRKNEPIYVGKGQGRRAYEHLSNAKNNHLRNRLAKMKANGIEPIINVVDMPSEALALQCEVDTIARFGRKDLKLGPLLNQTDGGEGASGWVPTEENRKNISDGGKGKSRNKGKDNPFFSKSHTLETCQKISDAGKGENHPLFGKSPSPESRKKMSDTLKGIPKVTCPHCSKEGAIGIMQRWHFDRCKSRIHPSII